VVGGGAGAFYRIGLSLGTAEEDNRGIRVYASASFVGAAAGYRNLRPGDFFKKFLIHCATINLLIQISNYPVNAG
jgi:hypothetical protein